MNLTTFKKEAHKKFWQMANVERPSSFNEAIDQLITDTLDFAEKEVTPEEDKREIVMYEGEGNESQFSWNRCRISVVEAFKRLKINQE